MAARRERLLLNVMCAALALAAAGAAFDLGFERLRRANSSIRQSQAQILALQQSLRSAEELMGLREQLTRALSEARKTLYSAGEMSPFTFGLQVRKELASSGITVLRYQVIEKKGVSCLDFSVSARVASLILFLKEVSENQRFWNISSFSVTVRENAPEADAELRIGYEIPDL